MKTTITTLFALTVLLFTACTKTADDNTIVNATELEMSLLQEINLHRYGIGTVNIHMNDYIQDVAREHSIKMANGEVSFNNDGSATRREILSGIFQIEEYTEIVGTGAAESMVESWLASKNHSQKLEGDYNLTGVGVGITRDGTVYATQILIKTKW